MLTKKYSIVRLTDRIYELWSVVTSTYQVNNIRRTKCSHPGWCGWGSHSNVPNKKSITDEDSQRSLLCYYAYKVWKILLLFVVFQTSGAWCKGYQQRLVLSCKSVNVWDILEYVLYICRIFHILPWVLYIILEEKTKEITRSVIFSNYHKIWWTFTFPWSNGCKTRLRLVFSTHFTVFGNWMKQSSSCFIYT